MRAQKLRSSTLVRLLTLIVVIISLWLAATLVKAVPSHPSSEKKPILREIRVEESTKYILSFDIANGSQLAATALADLSVRVWKLSTGEVVHTITFLAPDTDQRFKLDKDIEPISLRFSPDGKTLAVSFLNVIRLYNVETWQLEKSLGIEGEDKLRADVVVTPSTPQLRRRTASEAEAEKSKPMPTLNEGTKAWFANRARGDGIVRITDFAFTNDGSSILAAYCGGECFAWRSSRWVTSPTGKDPVRLWDLRTLNVVWEREYDSTGVIERVIPSEDGRVFGAVDAERGHCAVGIYRLNDGGQVSMLPFTPLCNPLPNIAFIENGQFFVTNRTDGDHRNKTWRTAAIYETATGKIHSDFSDNETVHNSDISSDGRWLASTTWNGLRFQIWDVAARKIISTQSPKEWKWKGPPIDRVRFSPDVRWLVVGSDVTGTVVVYEFEKT